MREDNGKKRNVTAGEIAVGFCVSPFQGSIAIRSHGLRERVVVDYSQAKAKRRIDETIRSKWTANK